ncbi:MAG: hypothetical protein ACYTFI_03255 [Planctomycetota bacterium]
MTCSRLDNVRTKKTNPGFGIRSGPTRVLALALVALLLLLVAAAGPARARSSDEARRRLEELTRERNLGASAARATGDRYYEAAKKAYEELDYAKSLELVEKAIEADPNHKEAVELARRVRSLLGTRPDWARYGLEELSREKKVQIQQNLFRLERTLTEGKKFMHWADETRPGDDERPAEMRLSRQIGHLDLAIEQFKRAQEIIKWMPYRLDLTSREKEARELLADALTARGEKEESLRVERRRKATQQAIDRRNLETEVLRERLQQMMAMARIQYDRGKLNECEDICKQILREDQTDKDAMALMALSRQKRHELAEEDLYIRHRHEWRKMWHVVEEAAIPYSDQVRYPKDWERIRRRVETAGKIEQIDEPEWEKEVRRKLDRKVSFEFAETPLTEAIAFLQTLTKVNMIIDPAAAEASGSTPITLKVTNMTLGLALDWILKLADLDFALRDNAIFISSRENLKGDVILRIYDVRDLTEQIPDFPGPELQVEVGGLDASSGGGGGLVLIGPDEGTGDTVTAESLAEMISSRVRPGDWAPELGTSIEERGGKLVVMQRPQVHRLIDRLLESFRASQKLMVNVEGRFLEIREGFFEEIGVDFGGIPDYHFSRGDVATAAPGTYLPYDGPSSLGEPWPDMAPNTAGYQGNQFGYNDDPNVLDGGYIVSDTLGQAGSVYGGVLPKPRNVDIFGSGQLHTIGAVTNYRPAVSPEQTTIGMDMGTGQLLEQGLNAQIRHIGDIELMAFIHALKIREGGSVLSAPRLTVMNTQRAHMFVAEQRSYIADYEISGEAWDPVIRQFLRGVVFDVKPIVSADRRYITLELRPTTAELRRVDEITITHWSILSGGTYTVVTVIDFPIMFPELELRKIRTTVTIPDGGIIMLGGMMSDIKFQSENGVPFLSNLPIVGRLFRWNIIDNERRNLTILVTGRIISFEEEEKKLR